MTAGKNEWDAIVIGGGPAGSAFALAAAKGGLKVLLIERTSGPHHKVCGEFISADTQALLSRSGVDLDRLGARKQHTLRLLSRRTQVACQLPFCGRSLSRKVLDEHLLLKAREAGAVVRRGTRVTHLDAGKSDGDCATVTLADGQTLSAAAIALATGASAIRGIERRQVSQLAGFKIMLSLTPAARDALDDHVQLMGYDGGYQGALLVEDGLASLAWIMEAKQAKRLGPDWQNHVAFLSRQSSVTGDMLSGATTDWPRPLAMSGHEFGFLRTSVIGPNIFPLGGQMAIIPSFTGDGMAIALGTGLRAARAVCEGLSAATYQQEMHDILKPQFRWARATHPLFIHGWTRRVGLAAARACPPIVTMLTNVTRLHNLSCDSSGAQTAPLLPE